jgi:hypothetical protein
VSTARWDTGDQPPDDTVIGLCDYTDGQDCNGCSNAWGRVTGRNGEWKGYKDGGKVYLDWAELTRRWGPLVAVTWTDDPEPS